MFELPDKNEKGAKAGDSPNGFRSFFSDDRKGKPSGFTGNRGKTMLNSSGSVQIQA